jgi:hypothetical protein
MLCTAVLIATNSLGVSQRLVYSYVRRLYVQKFLMTGIVRVDEHKSETGAHLEAWFHCSYQALIIESLSPLFAAYEAYFLFLHAIFEVAVYEVAVIIDLPEDD